jgi:hypothetical protein
MQDRNCVNTLSYKESLNGAMISKAEAVQNSEDWTCEEPISDNEDKPPAADPSVFSQAGPSSPPPRERRRPASRRLQSATNTNRPVVHGSWQACWKE